MFCWRAVARIQESAEGRGRAGARARRPVASWRALSGARMNVYPKHSASRDCSVGWVPGYRVDGRLSKCRNAASPPALQWAIWRCHAREAVTLRHSLPEF